jgi:hypothetical protein
MTKLEQIEKLRDEAADRGYILPPLPDCHAPWCAACNGLRYYWKTAHGIIIKCNEKL